MYKVGVIGLGHISMGYSGPEDKAPYVHVGGIRHSKKVELAAVADLSADAREAFRQKWGAAFPETLHYYDSDAAMLEAEDLDIVAICVRGPYHAQVINTVLAAGPKAIFLEKPPSCSLEEMDHWYAVAQAKGIPVTVSYSRHWAPHLLRLQKLVAEGLVGTVERVVGHTGNNVLSFASHNTDMICQFAGYCPSAVYGRTHLVEKNVAPEGFVPEPHLDTAVIEFENGVMGIQEGWSGEHGAFYVDVFGTEGYVRAGYYIPPYVADAKGNAVDLATLGIPENASAFQMAYDQIADNLDGGPLADCTGDPFRAVNEIGFGVIKSALSNQRVELPNINRSRKIWANG